MNIVIAGGSGGIGGAFVEKLAGRPNVENIVATYHRSNPPEVEHPNVSWQQLDPTHEAAIRDWSLVLAGATRATVVRRELQAIEDRCQGRIDGTTLFVRDSAACKVQ